MAGCDNKSWSLLTHLHFSDTYIGFDLFFPSILQCMVAHFEALLNPLPLVLVWYTSMPSLGSRKSLFLN